MERIVSRTGHVIRLPNGAKAEIRPQGVEADARVRCHSSRGRLVDVGLSLQVQTTTANVSDTEDGLPWHLVLERDVPVPCFRVLEGLALGCYHQYVVVGIVSSRVIHRTVRYAGVRLERWVAAQEDRVAHA